MNKKNIKLAIKSSLTVLVIALMVVALVVSDLSGIQKTSSNNNLVAKVGKYKITRDNLTLAGYRNMYAGYFGMNPNEMPEYFSTMIGDATIESFYSLVILEDAGLAISQKQISNELLNYFTKGNASELKPSKLREIDKVIALQKDGYYELAKNLVASKTISTYSRSLVENEFSFDKKFLEMMAEESVSLELVKLDDSIIEKESITDFYEKNKELFTELNISILTVREKKNAESLRDNLAVEPELFAEKVTEFSIDAFSGNKGKIDSSRYFQILKTLSISDDKASKELLTLQQNDIIGPIKVEQGFAIIKANSSSRESNLDIPSDFSIVKSYIKENEPKLYENSFKLSAENFTNRAKSDFSLAAAEQNVNIVNISNLPISYGNAFSDISDIQPELEIPNTNEEFINKMFASDDVFGPILDGERYYVGRISSREKLPKSIDIEKFKPIFRSMFSNASKVYKK
ncbi:MAG: peptidylprolyl isomerase [Spirochaetales bacterium]|nr:peptidylprolyl isomerase [Spirochaetales bacterium]